MVRKRPSKLCAGAGCAPSVGKPKMKVVEGASADAIRAAAVIERSIVDGKLDMVSAEALQKLMAAACRFTPRASKPASNSPVPKEFDFRHRRDGHGERIVESCRSRRIRARHVAKLDGPLTRFFFGMPRTLDRRKERSGETPWISLLIAAAA
jgi:hypothetical protein